MRRSRKSLKKSRKHSSRGKLGCRSLLSKKIRVNMKEYKSGRYSSRSQAIAVAFSMLRKSRPGCNKYFKKRSKRS